MMEHLLMIASILSSMNNGGGVLIQSIAHRHVQATGMGSIIVNVKASHNVDYMHHSTKLGWLIIDLTILAFSISKLDSGLNLRANVKI